MVLTVLEDVGATLLRQAEVVWLGWGAVEALLWHQRSCPLAHEVWRRARGLRRAADAAGAQPLAVDVRGLVRHVIAAQRVRGESE